MITLDTSAIYALLNRSDRGHERVSTTLRATQPPYLVPVAILSEVAYLVEARLDPRVLDAFLHDLEVGAYTADCGEADLPRIRALTRRYEDLPLGFSDAAVIACAERNRGLVLTLDERDFRVVEREGTIRVLP